MSEVKRKAKWKQLYNIWQGRINSASDNSILLLLAGVSIVVLILLGHFAKLIKLRKLMIEAENDAGRYSDLETESESE